MAISGYSTGVTRRNGKSSGIPVSAITRRLAIITPGGSTRGGADSIIRDLTEHLPSLGWSVTVGLAIGTRFNLPEAAEKLFGKVECHRIEPKRPTRTSRISSIRRYLEEVQPDIALAWRVGETIPAIAELKSEGVAIRLGVGVRGLEPAYYNDVLLCHDIIDGCFASGELARRLCVSLAGMEDRRSFNLPGGVTRPVRQRILREPGAPLRLGYVGRLAQTDKNILDLLSLAERLIEFGVNFRIDVAGSGPDEPELVGGLKKLLSADQFAMHGWCDLAELYNRIYPNLDVILNFSAREGATISPREGAAHGVVPVVSRFPGIELERLYVHGSNALVFGAGDVETAAKQIHRLGESPQLYELLSEGARASQAGKYSLEGNMAAWRDAFETLVVLPRKHCYRLAVEPEGRAERWGVPESIAHALRSALGRVPGPLDPGAEWPQVWARQSSDWAERFETWVRRLDAVAAPNEGLL